MQKVTTFLMFNDQAEEAVNFYVSIFKNSKIVSLLRSEGEGPIPKGKVLQAIFQLDGQEFFATDGGPYFTFSEGISLLVNCETQEEIDELQKQQCGWVKDKYGVSWQIVPSVLGEMLRDRDAEKSKRVMNAVWQMNKIDLKTLEQAYGQR
jgi:predicted 3-demethylubiquinone-9 3-methyltransferase (glyoxalase superfamily)